MVGFLFQGKKGNDPVEQKQNGKQSEPSSRRSPPGRTMSLSQHLLRQASGLCCEACGRANISSSSSRPGLLLPPSTNDLDDNEDEPITQTLGDYNLRALSEQGSAVSPMVLAPMTMPLVGTPKYQGIMETIITEYMGSCRFYGIPDRINAGVLTTIRFSLPSLRTSGSFHDSDMLALAEILLRYANGPLKYIKRLDFSLSSKEGKLHGRTGFRSHGALTLSKVLQHSAHIEEVLLQRHNIGPFGASAIFIACAENESLQRINMRRCQIGERGALAFAELVATSSVTGLQDIDLSANRIGFKGSVAMEKAMLERSKRQDLRELTVDLEGNLLFQEVMNGVTHGLGIMLALLGASLLSKRVEHLSHRHQVSCAVYSTSLIILYLSSTLYHSSVTLRNVKYILEVMDKSAIYILIAGSYTPFLQIVLASEPRYSVHLLAFLWSLCFFGIGVEAFYPTWRYKGLFSLAMYLGMGWSSVVVLPEATRLLPDRATELVILGGVAYTTGVPFFVRDNNFDHSLWHLFVLAGSIFHWCGVYFYVAPVTFE